MEKGKFVVLTMLATCVFALISSNVIADVKGDINDDNKIDLVEAIYALKITTQSNGNALSRDLIDDRTFFSIHENSTGGETCIIEASYDGATSQVTAQEWLYINDNNWTPGCLEEYIPNETGTFPYTIVNGVLEMDIGSVVWPTELIEISNDNYLMSNPDGFETWYFSKDKVDSLLGPQLQFTQAMLSANSWYPVEVSSLSPTAINCNGIFIFDGFITQTAQFIENGNTESISGAYLLHEGKLSSFHDSKIETEIVESMTENYFVSIKSVLRVDGTTNGTGDKRIYIKNKQYAKAYMAAGGVNVSSCFEDTDTTNIIDFVGSWTGAGVSIVGGQNADTEITVSLTDNAGSLSGSLAFDAGQAVDISGSMTNGILTFIVPPLAENVGNPDCVNWDLHAAATLNSSPQSMNLIFSGDVCGPGGSQPGIIESTLTK